MDQFFYNMFPVDYRGDSNYLSFKDSLKNIIYNTDFDQ